jgi:hypothetical protein
MKSIIELLKEKNHCLEKFFRINEAELENFGAGNFGSLEVFYSSREGLLGIVSKIDEMIERENNAGAETVDAAMKASIQSELKHKNELVNRILEQDLLILSAIEKEKSVIIKELCQVRATRKAVGAYGGETSGGNLDEEA